MQKSDLEIELNRMKADEANLKDALLKLHSLNDALNHDKNELGITVVKVFICICFFILSIEKKTYLKHNQDLLFPLLR